MASTVTPPGLFEDSELAGESLLDITRKRMLALKSFSIRTLLLMVYRLT